MSELCFIITCKGRLDHLKQTLPTVVAIPQSVCVVVDYSCPQNTGDWVEQHYPSVRVVRVSGQKYYMPCHARNQGAAIVTEPWLCFLDADVKLKPEFAGIFSLLRPGRFFRATPPAAKELSGTVICLWKDYRRVGGYDDVLEGWGANDLEFFSRLRELDLKEEQFPTEWVEPIPHSDELRGQFAEIKDVSVSWTFNALYAQIKLDLARVLNREVTLVERQYLYAQVKDWVLRVLRGNAKRSEMKVAIRKHQLGGGVVNGYLVYEFKGVGK